jgi:dinuclear metal center YbgI/SA1388 family protein
MKIKEIISYLESYAPLSLQEPYDNAGLLIGDREWEVSQVLCTLDVNVVVVEEAIRKRCNLIISHHPLIFHALKKLSGTGSVQQTIVKAVKADIAIYAMHTNFDNSFHGLNEYICKQIGLSGCAILSPVKGMLSKLVTFCPTDHAEKVRNALFDAGAGRIGKYDNCSYSGSGEGTFRASDEANPFVGEKNVIHHEPEVRIEVIYPVYLEQNLISALIRSHPYEEVAYDLYPLSNAYPEAGAGMIGNLDSAMEQEAFLKKIKSVISIPVLRVSGKEGQPIRKVAVCTGSGSFLINHAFNSGADALLTADLKYHDFFDAPGNMLLIDIGHFESETFAKEIIVDILIRKFPNFAFLISEINTNPIRYY